MHTGFIVADISESNVWQSLPRPVVDCIQVHMYVLLGRFLRSRLSPHYHFEKRAHHRPEALV
jgi:hypothetical protein